MCLEIRRSEKLPDWGDRSIFYYLIICSVVVYNIGFYWIKQVTKWFETIFQHIPFCFLVFLTAIAEGGPWASDCAWQKKKNNEGGSPLASRSRSPGRESTQRLCTCFIFWLTFWLRTFQSMLWSGGLIKRSMERCHIQQSLLSAS